MSFPLRGLRATSIRQLMLGIALVNAVLMFQELCRIAVESGGFRFARVGLLDEASGAVVPAAHWGHEEGYLNGIRINLDDEKTGHGPKATVTARGVHVMIEAGLPLLGRLSLEGGRAYNRRLLFSMPRWRGFRTGRCALGR